MSANRGAKLTLYWLDRSRAQRIMWLMEELKLSYDVQVFHRRPNGIAPPELKQIHSLGKSPILSIAMPNAPKPTVLVESGVILEYLLDHYGAKSNLVPKRYRDGQEGEVGGETESWMRYRHFMHYAEGSLMSPIQVQLIMNALNNGPVPFFIKPIVSMITGRIGSEFLNKELETHFKFLEEQLGSAPDSGPFLCGNHLTAADIQMIIPVQAALGLNIIKPSEYPRLEQYAKKLEGFEAYQTTVKKVEELEGKPFVPI